MFQVLKFLVTSIRGKDEMGTLDSNREEEERFQQEFREYQDKTKKAKEEWVFWTFCKAFFRKQDYCHWENSPKK